MSTYSNIRFICSCLLFLVVAPGVGIAAPLLYVSSQTSPTISVIDTANNQIVATVPARIGSEIVANAAGTRVAFLTPSGGLSVIATANNAVVLGAGTGASSGSDVSDLVWDFALNAAGTRFYVAMATDCGGWGCDGNDVYVFDFVTDKTTFAPIDFMPTSIAVNPAGTRIYVGASVIDAATMAVLAQIPVSGVKIAMDAAGTRLYALSGDGLSVIDAATNAVIATTALPWPSSDGVAMVPAGTRVYVASSHSNNLLVFDAATLAAAATVPLGSGEHALAADPTGSRVYVTRSDDVAVLDAPTNTLMTAIPVPRPSKIAVSAAVPAAANYQGLWWAAGGAENGWGINIAHPGERLFATWYTYDTTGKAWWLSMLAARTPGTESFSGAILADAGPSFDHFVGQGAARQVGSGTIDFSDTNHGTFAYSLDIGTGGSPVPISQQKAIERYDLHTGAQPTCVFFRDADPWTAPTAATNYQGLWWEQTGAESGWGINFAHQGDTVFATWYTYDTSGAPLWLSALAPRVAGGNIYTGALYRTSGPRFDAYDMTKRVGAPLGTATFTFLAGNNAKFEYATNGSGGLPAVTQSKWIVRYPFDASAITICN